MVQDRFREDGYKFLTTEIRVGRTITRIGLQSSDLEKRKRCGQLARQAHDAVVKFRDQVSLSSDQAAEIGSGLLTLRAELQQLTSVS
jgi:hypothetical protein